MHSSSPFVSVPSFLASRTRIDHRELGVFSLYSYVINCPSLRVVHSILLVETVRPCLVYVSLTKIDRPKMPWMDVRQAEALDSWPVWGGEDAGCHGKRQPGSTQTALQHRGPSLLESPGPRGPVALNMHARTHTPGALSNCLWVRSPPPHTYTRSCREGGGPAPRPGSLLLRTRGPRPLL